MTPSADRRPIESVTVYCASSPHIHADYFKVAREFGTLLGASGRRLVYGGGSLGLMGEISRACRAAGGQVTGIITERLRDAELLDPDNHENIVVPTMRERKRLLEARGDAFVIMPGGLGTLEEFFEILVGRLLGEHAKQVILLDPLDPTHPESRTFFTPLRVMIDHMIDNGFAKREAWNLAAVCESPRSVLTRLDEAAPASEPTMNNSFIPAAPMPPDRNNDQP
ncbi:MAG: TIGR00730 family Rossman fold protein [Phycisphaeraceae bacterium]|nr:TIGR00730 family Rossman fold protein [Phycisphaeraceae bacterium]